MRVPSISTSVPDGNRTCVAAAGAGRVAPVVYSMAPPPAPAPPVTARPPTKQELNAYTWLSDTDRIRPLMDVFDPPEGYQRVELKLGTFGAWLRSLPLKEEGAPVLTYRGDVLHPEIHHVLKGHPQPDGLNDPWRAGFEFHGWIDVEDGVLAHFLDHVPTAHKGAHLAHAL